MSEEESTAKKRLFEVASLQDGYFTSKQAKEAGYIDVNYGYHIKAGNWIRAWRGIYRLSRFPVSENEQYILWYLWSMNRNKEPQGVYSHETCLNIFELSDVSPSRLHMTVPFNFRRNSPIPKVLVLHKGKLKEEEIIHMRGIAVTTPIRAILDVAIADSTSRDHVYQSIKEGYHRGIILVKEYRNLMQSKACPNWLRETIDSIIK